MLDFHRLVGQMQDFSAYRREEDVRHADRLARACAALADCAAGWHALRDAVLADAERLGPRSTPLRAVPHDAPDAAGSAPPRPDLVTVVAADGSQIFPDRHVEPTCYLLNVGRIAFQYGTDEPPLMAAEPVLRYRAQDLQELAVDDDTEAARFDVTAEVVSALRDELELRWLFETAFHERRSGRPLVALADGTLIRWMLRGMKNRALENRLVARYIAELERFREAGLPVCSYVSRPANTEVVNLLRFHLAEPDDAPAEASLRGLLDRHIFERTLAVGQRSALFASGSRILKEYGPHHHIGYFYVRLPDEVARVELPRWVAEQPGWLDLLHAVVLDQAEKGGGYPIILSEAHERAVVRAAEKEIFYRILARQLRGSGAPLPTYSGKSAAKRAPRV